MRHLTHAAKTGVIAGEDGPTAFFFTGRSALLYLALPVLLLLCAASLLIHLCRKGR